MRELADVLHSIQHWIHLRPVAYVVWACTVVAVALFLWLGARQALRRLLRSGDRAPKRVCACLLLVFIGLGGLALLDAGVRPPETHSAVAATESQFAQNLTTSQPFSLFSYRSLNLKLSTSSSVLGVVPEVTGSPKWADLRHGGTAFSSPVVGLVPDLRTVLYSGRSTSPALSSAVSRWHTKLQALAPGHVYCSEAIARRYSVKRNDVLRAPIGDPTAQDWTVQGIVPPDVLVPGPSIVASASSARSIAGAGNGVNRLVVFVAGDGSRVGPGVRSAILSASAQLPAHTASSFRVVGTVTVVRPAANDWTRRVAVACAIVVLFACLCLAWLGRRRGSNG